MLGSGGVRGDVGKFWGRYGKVCWGVGKVRGDVGRGVGKCWERSGKMCWSVGEVGKDVGRGVGGRALNELMRSLTFTAHMLHCEGR